MAAGLRSAPDEGRTQLLEVAQLLAAQRRAIDTIIEYAGKLPSPQCEIFIGTIGGADDARGARRDGLFEPRCQVRDERARTLGDRPQRTSDASRGRASSSRSHEPFASAGAYINFLTQEEADRIAFAYGPTFKRLVDLKKKYDPTNFFRMNQNIKPQ